MVAISNHSCYRVVLFCLVSSLALSCSQSTDDDTLSCDFSTLETTQPDKADPGRYHIDNFDVVLDAVWGLAVTHTSDSSRPLFSTTFPGAFIAADASVEFHELRGNYSISENETRSWTALAPEHVWSDGRRIILEGGFGGDDDATMTWTARFCQAGHDQLEFEITATGNAIGAITLRADLDADEKVFGLGEQFPRDTLDLRGRKWPILVREQGIGRGEPNVSEVMDLLSPGSSGDETTTYSPVPHYVTSQNRSLFLENTEVSVFDLTTNGKADIKVYAPTVRGRILHGTTPLELIETFSQYAGRMPEPPTWIDNGAIVALAGEDLYETRDTVAFLVDHGARLSGIWNQTWCGTATTILGEQVLWNWVLPAGREAEWTPFVSELANEGIVPLCYINPMFRDLPDDAAEGSRNLYRELIDNDYAIKKASNEPYLLEQGVFEVAIIDLSNPDAREWMKTVIRDEVIGRAGCRGYMADYAEAMPFDGILASGEDPAEWHNRYPIEWAMLNREARDEAGMGDQVLVFHRSGFTQTPGYIGMQWLGDQTVTWDGFDGMKSALLGMLGSGFSAISLNHSDTGGYTGIPVGNPAVSRDAELLLRWTEMNAFTSLLRTHEGNRPDDNIQVYSNEIQANHFAKFTKIFVALAPYRRTLYADAAEHGWPVVRHLAMQFSKTPAVWDIHDEFMLGPYILVAPILEPCGSTDCTAEREVILPPGNWRHIWTKTTYISTGIDDSSFTIQSPIGEPPVFVRYDSDGGRAILEALEPVISL